jgi:hypothetical protein
LFGASGLLFIIACSNVANLILARTVRRESELAIRAALGASAAALRRSLLAEGLVLCGSGGLAGVLVAIPMVTVLARYALRFSVRAADLTVDFSLLWMGLALALAAAVFLAFVPRLPSDDSSTRTGAHQRLKPNHRPQPSPDSRFHGCPSRRVIPLVGECGCVADHIALHARSTAGL